MEEFGEAEVGEKVTNTVEMKTSSVRGNSMVDVNTNVEEVWSTVKVAIENDGSEGDKAVTVKSNTNGEKGDNEGKNNDEKRSYTN
jgi:hypothetical protein